MTLAMREGAEREIEESDGGFKKRQRLVPSLRNPQMVKKKQMLSLDNN